MTKQRFNLLTSKILDDTASTEERSEFVLWTTRAWTDYQSFIDDEWDQCWPQIDYCRRSRWDRCDDVDDPCNCHCHR